MKPIKRFTQLREISVESLLEESNHIKYIWYAIVLIAIILFVFLIWSAIVTIKEVAVTYGQLVPKGYVRVVQHLEGGIVKTVFVEDGEKVKKGQIVIKLNPVTKQAELSQLRSREIALVLDKERLNAYLHGQKANLLKWSNEVIESKYNTVKHKKQIEVLLQNEKNHLAAQNAKRKAQQEVIKTLITQRQEKLTEALNQKKVWDKQVKLLQEEFKTYQELKAKKLVVNKDYVNVLQQLTQAKGEQIRTVSQIQQIKQSILEAKNRLIELNKELHQEAEKELNEANNQLLEVRHMIEKIENQLSRLAIRAPTSGIVKGLRVSAGTVVKPGGELLEIVPLNQELVVETKLNPRDVGHISIGDPVNVKVMSFDFAHYGSLHGTLTNISASTFTDSEGRPYYKATAKLNQQYIEKDGSRKNLIPGMTVQADIITGEKTLLQYILKPIQRTTSTAFQER